MVKIILNSPNKECNIKELSLKKYKAQFTPFLLKKDGLASVGRFVCLCGGFNPSTKESETYFVMKQNTEESLNFSSLNTYRCSVFLEANTLVKEPL